LISGLRKQIFQLIYHPALWYCKALSFHKRVLIMCEIMFTTSTNPGNVPGVQLFFTLLADDPLLFCRLW